MIGLFKIAVSVLPVLAFLLVLVYLDSYQLVSSRSVATSILVGALAAGVCVFVNRAGLAQMTMRLSDYSLYIAPVVEESAKAAYLIGLFKAKRIGFMVDGAIHGFAVGAGFALVENVYCLFSLEGTSLLVWVIRGFGTAAMHGTATAVFGIMSRSLGDRYTSEKMPIFLPGLAVAVVVHSLFNHFLFSPLLTTIILFVALPALLLIVFDRSEKTAREWLGLGFDTDQELLDILTTGRLTDSRVGKYLESLKARFPGTVVADMFCLLSIHTELSLRAKGVLMMQQVGIRVAPDPEVREKLTEMKFLEKSIGKTGRLAIQPFLGRHAREIWQLSKAR